MHGFQEKVNFIWALADLLRGDYKQSEYGKIILPLTVLRLLDGVPNSTGLAFRDLAERPERRQVAQHGHQGGLPGRASADLMMLPWRRRLPNLRPVLLLRVFL